MYTLIHSYNKNINFFSKTGNVLLRSTPTSALRTSLQDLPVSPIRRAGLIQKLRILRSFSCNVKCDSVVCAEDVGRQHSCLLRSFSCIAIFQLSRLVRVCFANAKKAECEDTLLFN